MNYLKTGQFYGRNKKTISLEGLTITETKYDYEFVDWHYHENPHFTLITLGDIKQGTRRETYECSADTLLFHNCQEPHYNVKPEGITRGFQLEVGADWYRKFEVDLGKLPPVTKVTHPNVRLLFYNIFKESRLSDRLSSVTIDSLLLEALGTMSGVESFSSATEPRWVTRIRELLHDNFDQPISLQELSKQLDVHWAHLSRDFRKYFGCNFGQYVRKVKVEKSLPMLRVQDLSITEIAFICGFADQSHFIRCFREFTGVTPGEFRSLVK